MYLYYFDNKKYLIIKTVKVIEKDKKNRKKKESYTNKGKECGWVIRRVAGRLNSPNEPRFMKNNHKRCLVTCRTR